MTIHHSRFMCSLFTSMHNKSGKRLRILISKKIFVHINEYAVGYKPIYLFYLIIRHQCLFLLQILIFMWVLTVKIYRNVWRNDYLLFIQPFSSRFLWYPLLTKNFIVTNGSIFQINVERSGLFTKFKEEVMWDFGKRKKANFVLNFGLVSVIFHSYTRARGIFRKKVLKPENTSHSNLTFANLVCDDELIQTKYQVDCFLIYFDSVFAFWQILDIPLLFQQCQSTFDLYDYLYLNSILN